MVTGNQSKQEVQVKQKRQDGSRKTKITSYACAEKKGDESNEARRQ